ncbi:flavin-binding monooxygenase-like protein-like protein [Mollisia scopiformis]|uniref:Flavin-binding monooxygenase-like protein-like protein n=1 Tax=Mollisia scopiformis TaxID=149040 RepID=A0A132B750_MOLSC|nr:flavin-binding monooxygenase-like protein-like protein [Mollisia scopiformis]KUJ08232.1 flavin-binding monooxygenase-like protein-like protein [Mollisia scopiformis]
MNPETDFEIIIIGAGISGIIAAQRYLEAHPTTKLTILERDSCIGGVFSKRRLYPEFWTQWTHGIAEFADMKMPRPPEEDCRNDCFKARYTTEYLEKYVDEKMHEGRSLRDRVRFGVQVKGIEKVDGRWRVSCVRREEEVVFWAEKLMLANGENSLPNIPSFAGREGFQGKIIHSQDFGSSNILSAPEVQHVAVLGAGKSAADMVYEAVQQGKTVSWIISKNGTGPGFFAPIDTKSPYRNVVEAAQTRVMSTLQPSITGPENWWTGFLHRTWVGRWLVGFIFTALDKSIRDVANYKGRASEKGFKGLEYDTPIFWQNGTGGAVHHPDLWSSIAENVSVYREDITSLGPKSLTFTSGLTIPTDALLLGTGWKLGLEFFSPSSLLSLDLPHDPSTEDPAIAEKWKSLEQEGDAKILRKFPILANPPPHHHRKIPTTPYRLHHCIAPLHDRSIVFLNHITAGNKLFAAEAQAMWVCAYFSGDIKLPSIEEREKRIAEWLAWGKRRYLSNGEIGTFAVFDAVGYADLLLGEMGVRRYREKGWWRFWMEPFWPSDLGIAWREYLDGRKGE